MLNVRPCNKENAIKTVAFALELEKEISESTITAIQNLYKENKDFQDDFPLENVLSSVKVQMGVGVQQISSTAISGVNYLSSETNPNWILRIQGKTISITCNAYTRWEHVWGYSRKYFGKIIECFDDYSLIKVALEYLDEFQVSDTKNNIWIDELFKDSSPYLPKFIYEMKEPWHSHNGFITEDAARRTINLININFGKTNTSSGLLTMQTQHASTFYQAHRLEVNVLDQIIEVMEHNHQANKDLLDVVLSDEMLDIIKLKV